MKNLNISTPLERSAQIRIESVDSEQRTVEFVISNESVDSFNTVFKSSGWDLSRYNLNPIVTYNHFDFSPDPDVVIGTSELRQEGLDLIGKVFFESAEDNPLAEKVFKKVQNNILRGASINARPIDARMGVEDLGEDPEVLYFTRQELVAWSIVTLPSNSEALLRSQEQVKEITNTISKKPIIRKITPTDKTLRPQEAQLLINRNYTK